VPTDDFNWRWLYETNPAAAGGVGRKQHPPFARRVSMQKAPVSQILNWMWEKAVAEWK
jgi:hypothetical protein